ncbi:hypothetical protein GIB67_023821 [Kingdonia uniflora]|uniref:Uncharacterized protein n=1 Tax=Kingdonia uniflora TaxID=39325 RepID=A0A7J7NFU7_9MAGN|nr:hypothetical protein GIB67_023821 [Kingdonia uniflora]
MRACASSRVGKGVLSSSDFILVSTGTAEYTLTKEDVGHLLVFVYIPINFEGQEGKSSKIVSQIVKQAPPKVNNLKIVGELREGNKVTVTALVTGGIEGSSRVQWFKTSSSKLEGETALEALSTPKIAKAFRIPLGAVGHYIVAKFTPMTPDGESGEPAYLVSAKAVETLPPSLNFLSVTGDYLEGEMLTASYGYIGGHEGKSDYNWYLHKVEADPGALIPEASGYLQYRITKDAIGKYISFKCTPVRDDGIWGEPRTLTGQERVRPGNPKLLTLRLLGKAIEGTTLHVDKKYWGGEEGDSVFRWFLADSDGTQSEIISANAASYTLSSDDIGLLISVACEPVRSDLARGLSVLSEKIGPVIPGKQIGPVIPGPPTCQSLQFLGSIMEGQKLVFDATYTGGERGTCSHEWFRMSCNGVKEKLSDDDYLNLTVDDVGSCIELIYTPMRKDGVKGAPKHVVSEIVPPAEPTCLELIIPYCCEDIEVFPKKSYYGGKEGNGEYVWYKTKAKMQGSDLTNVSNLCEDVFVCGRSLTYTPSLEDVGSYLVLYWVPTRTDRKCGEPSVAISSEPVSPAHPIVSNVHVEELSSGIYSGGGNYYGGHEGSSLFSWYRETKEGTIVLISGASSTVYEVDDSDYTCRLLFGTPFPTLEEAHIYCLSDQNRRSPMPPISGIPLETSNMDVRYAYPAPLSVPSQTSHTSSPSLSPLPATSGNSRPPRKKCAYFASHAGNFAFASSIYASLTSPWVVETGTTDNMTGMSSISPQALRYTPVRSDSAVGELRLSESTGIILPELLQVEMLTFTGKAVEGEKLTAVEVISNSEVQQRVWSEYKKVIKYQWFLSTDAGDDKPFEPLPLQQSSSYKVRMEDIGCCLKCQSIVTDVFGRSSKPMVAETAPVLPGIPKIDKLEIEGRGFHTNLYAIRGIYSGGKEGKSRVQWLRSMVGSPDLISIPGEIGRIYEANVDDVGYRLVAVYTPIREDGVEGQPVSASTEPIAVEPDVLKEVKQKLDLGSVKFEALCDKDRSPRKVPGVGSLERRILEVNRKRVKVLKPGSKTSFPATEIRGTYTPPFHVELFRNDQHRLRIVVDSENEVDLMVQTRHLRDVIVLVIRGLAQKFNSTSLNSLLKIET